MRRKLEIGQREFTNEVFYRLVSVVFEPRFRDNPNVCFQSSE
jgi:hypothetical protein